MENLALAGAIGWQQVLLIAVVILLLFGGRKLPELMKGVGKGIKGFKDEMSGEGTAADDKKASSETSEK